MTIYEVLININEIRKLVPSPTPIQLAALDNALIDLQERLLDEYDNDQQCLILTILNH